MSAQGPSERGIISGINVTPLVDITLVLLIIFMVTAKIVMTPALPMELPRAASSEAVQVIFSVLLPADGRVLVDGAVIASDELLVEKARAAQRDDSELRAVIHADGSVPHRRVMHILDLLRGGAGISRVAFGTSATPEHDGERAAPARAAP
jgi:biopolymer transport protein ExbD